MIMKPKLCDTDNLFEKVFESNLKCQTTITNNFQTNIYILSNTNVFDPMSDVDNTCLDININIRNRETRAGRLVMNLTHVERDMGEECNYTTAVDDHAACSLVSSVSHSLFWSVVAQWLSGGFLVKRTQVPIPMQPFRTLASLFTLRCSSSLGM